MKILVGIHHTVLKFTIYLNSGIGKDWAGQRSEIALKD